MTLPNPVPLLSSSMVAPCLSGLDRLATTNLARSGATDQNPRKILYAIAARRRCGAALCARRRRLLTASLEWCPAGYCPSGDAGPSAHLPYSGTLCWVVPRSKRGGNQYEAGDDPGSFAGDVAGACTGRWAKSSIVLRPNVLQA